MATQTINFSADGSRYYSDPIEVTGNALVVNIKLETAGGIVLERSITGEGFVYAETLQASFYTNLSLEKGISGCVPGQKLRLRFEGGAKPETITVLQ